MFKIIKKFNLLECPQELETLLFKFRNHELKIYVSKEKTGMDAPYLSAQLNKENLIKLKNFIFKIENDDGCNACFDSYGVLEKNPHICEFKCGACNKIHNWSNTKILFT